MSIMPIRECRMRRRIASSEILFLKGEGGTVGIVKSVKPRMIFMGAPNNEEIILFIEKDDILVISAFGEGSIIEKGIKSMAFLLREMESPIIILPKNHPTSKRLKMVVSVGNTVRLDCDITPGTHPEQDILCSCQELSGIKLMAVSGGVIIEGDVEHIKLDKL